MHWRVGFSDHGRRRREAIDRRIGQRDIDAHLGVPGEQPAGIGSVFGGHLFAVFAARLRANG
jgi:hypothetical protein